MSKSKALIKEMLRKLMEDKSFIRKLIDEGKTIGEINIKREKLGLPPLNE